MKITVGQLRSIISEEVKALSGRTIRPIWYARPVEDKDLDTPAASTAGLDGGEPRGWAVVAKAPDGDETVMTIWAQFDDKKNEAMARDHVDMLTKKDIEPGKRYGKLERPVPYPAQIFKPRVKR